MPDKGKGKYYDLVETRRVAGYKSEVNTVEVGSRGMLDKSSINKLKQAVNAPVKEFADLLKKTIRVAIIQNLVF